MKPIRLYLLFLLLMAFLCACETVQPYQRMYLNDKDMALKPVPEAGYENSFESYREGAAGATGGKSGGGCGCN
jgi:hypothetical protein